MMEPQSQPMMEPQSQPMNQSQPAVYLERSQSRQSNHTKSNYASKPAMIISIIQISVGIACLLLGVLGIAGSHQNSLNLVGAGIWSGILFMAVGAVGFGAAKTKKHCLIICFMVLTILCALFTAGILTVSGIEVWMTLQDDYSGGNKETSQAINAILLVLAFIELFVAIVAAALCCSTLCVCFETHTAEHRYQHLQAVDFVDQPDLATRDATGIRYYSPRPPAYMMQQNRVMLSQGPTFTAMEPLLGDQGYQPTDCRAAGDDASPPPYAEIEEESFKTEVNP